MLAVPPRPSDTEPVLLERWKNGAFTREIWTTNGWCTRCGRSWGFRPRQDYTGKLGLQHHSTPYCLREVGGQCDVEGCEGRGIESHGACFPLCEDCWSELTPEQRVPFYQILMDHWKSGWTEGDPELQIKAVLHSVRLGR